eukprot:SAG11_NODE_2388_length_3416_cov_2.842327_3_plen_68_part_00
MTLESKYTSENHGLCVEAVFVLPPGFAEDEVLRDLDHSWDGVLQCLAHVSTPIANPAPEICPDVFNG